jgi:hypothetical protein
MLTFEIGARRKSLELCVNSREFVLRKLETHSKLQKSTSGAANRCNRSGKSRSAWAWDAIEFCAILPSLRAKAEVVSISKPLA